jgi:hypothetical protein
MGTIKTIVQCIGSLENCIKVQTQDFPEISRSEAEEMGKLLHKILTCADDTERERILEEYRALRGKQAKIGQNRPENAL